MVAFLNEFLKIADKPWEPVGDSSDGLLKELNFELHENHPLFWKPLTPVLRRGDCDDVLFEIWAWEGFSVVHLTWPRRKEFWPWPSATIYHSFESIKKRILADAFDKAHRQTAFLKDCVIRFCRAIFQLKLAIEEKDQGLLQKEVCGYCWNLDWHDDHLCASSGGKRWIVRFSTADSGRLPFFERQDFVRYFISSDCCDEAVNWARFPGDSRLWEEMILRLINELVSEGFLIESEGGKLSIAGIPDRVIGALLEDLVWKEIKGRIGDDGLLRPEYHVTFPTENLGKLQSDEFAKLIVQITDHSIRPNRLACNLYFWDSDRERISAALIGKGLSGLFDRSGSKFGTNGLLEWQYSVSDFLSNEELERIAQLFADNMRNGSVYPTIEWDFFDVVTGTAVCLEREWKIRVQFPDEKSAKLTLSWLKKFTKCSYEMKDWVRNRHKRKWWQFWK